MTTDDCSSDRPPRSWGCGLLVAGLIGVVLGVGTSRYAADPLARELFGRVPVEYLLDLDHYRAELTRQFALAFVAGFVGPADPPTKPPGVSPGDHPSGTDRRTSDGPDESNASRANTGETPEADPSAGDSHESEASDQQAPIPANTPEFTLDRRQLNRRLKHPDRVRDHVSLVSERGADGQPVGIRILQLKGWFGQFGLRPGDVVRSVNGTPINSRQQAIATLAGMRKETDFTLDIVRNDNRFQIRYHVPHVAN